MIINSLTATFGKLNNDTIKFHDGLNVIEAPNESGKSTWCAFIRAMLYGVDSSERAKAGYLPAKQRYAPWSGAPMEGTMDLISDKCRITLTRTTKNKNAPMREFSAVYTGTNTEVEELNSGNAGEMLTGVSKEVFTRTAFVEQGASAVTGNPELEKKIMAIFSSGEEDISFSEAESRLVSWQKKRKSGHRGKICELDESIDEKERQLESMSGIYQEIAALESQLSQCRENCAETEVNAARARKQQREETVLRIRDARDETERLSEEFDRSFDELNECRNELKSGRFGIRREEDVERETQADLEEIEAIESEKTAEFPVFWPLIFLALAIAGAVVYECLYKLLPVIIASGAFCAAFIFLLFLYRKRKKLIQSKADRVDELLQKYSVESTAQLDAALDEYHVLSEKLRMAEKKAYEARQAWQESKERLSEIEHQLIEDMDSESGASQAAVLGREFKRLQQQQIDLTERLGAEKERLRMLGDPLVVRSELENMKELRRTLQSEYDAIGLALKTLEGASGEIQSRFSPELGKTAAKYMGILTDGKYEDVLLSRDFSAKTKTAEDAVARDSEFLSAGTLDCMYLSVRLAVCELAMPFGETCPLIIDDALVNLDDARYERAIALLSEIARQRQVILFTCRK